MAKLDWQRFMSSRASGRMPELMFTVVAGTTSATNIAVAGIRIHDGLVAVLEFQDTACATVGGVADRVGGASITSAGNIQLTTPTTTGHGLVVVWMKRRP